MPHGWSLNFLSLKERILKIGLLDILAFAIIIAYLSVSFVIIKDFGITWDAPENLGVGHKYLHFYATGHLDFKDDIPDIKGHPDFYDNWLLRYHPYIPGSFANILSAATCYIFFQTLRLLDPISAHHIIIPILTALFLCFFFLFVKRHFGIVAAFFSLACLITYPRFFSHSMNNIKDAPVAIFSSLTIMFFAEWYSLKRTKYLYASFLTFGMALATKMNAVTMPFIIFIWLIDDISKSIKDRTIYNKDMIIKFIVGSFITGTLFIACYPTLLSGGYGRIRFLKEFIYYIGTTGISPHTSWNLYAPKYILFVTPPLVLLVFFIGLLWLCFNIRRHRFYPLLLVWLLVPIARHCFPNIRHIDGLRYFLVFVAPFAVIFGIGAENLINACARSLRLRSGVVGFALFGCVFIWNISSLAHLHPYQITYFNIFVGGLKGAQEKNIEYSSDYWLSSSREIGMWLDAHARKGSWYCAYPPHERRFNTLVGYYITRKDCKPITAIEMLYDTPQNLYLIVIPRYWDKEMDRRVHALADRLKVVHRIERDGGTIATIYYNP